MLDSEAVFKSRLSAVGLSDAYQQKLRDEDITTMAKMAFLVNNQPGVGDYQIAEKEGMLNNKGSIGRG